MREDFDDADLTDEWVERYRIPIIRNPYPTWKYEVALVIHERSSDWDPWSGERPSESEAAMIGSLIEYRQDWYNGHWKAIHHERVLDVDSGTNSLILTKHPTRGWLYRRATWTMGQTYWPYFVFDGDERRDPPVLSLLELLDHVYEHDRHWTEWKAAHPETYGASPAPTES